MAVMVASHEMYPTSVIFAEGPEGPDWAERSTTIDLEGTPFWSFLVFFNTTGR
jgi:hypothetical protein